MSDAVANLEENLKQQTYFLQELSKLASLKREALVRNELRELETVVLQEEQLIMQIRRLEEQRLIWATDVSRDLGQAPEKLTLAELAMHFPSLRQVHKELNEILKQLRLKHEINAQLLGQALAIVNFTLGIFKVTDKGTYAHPLHKDSTPGKIHFLDRTI